jgi:D-lactate dehydrogenase
MKKGVVFINTARGTVVNTEDWCTQMDIGSGLDVYEKKRTIFFGNHITEKLEIIYTLYFAPSLMC